MVSKLFIVLVLAAKNAWSSGPIGSIPVRVINHTGKPLDLFWHDTSARGIEPRLVKQTTKPIRNDSDTSVNSYDTHEFCVRFSHHIDGVEVYFTKGPTEETVTISYDPNTNNLVAVTRTKLDELMDKIKAASADCDQLNESEYSECVSDMVLKEVAKIQDSKSVIASYRDVMSDRLRNYLCADHTIENSNSTSRSLFNYDSGGENLEVANYLDTPHAKIFTIDGFLTNDECTALAQYHQSEADESLESISTVRYDFDYLLEGGAGPVISTIHERVKVAFRFRGSPTVPEQGQEDVYLSVYSTGGETELACDGVCDGRAPLPGARIATATLFCEVPTKGGLVVFPRADVYLRPKYGSGVFVTYFDSTEGVMDEGFVARSECPVAEGKKFQATIHLRRDVSRKHNWAYYADGATGLRPDGSATISGDEF